MHSAVTTRSGGRRNRKRTAFYQPERARGCGSRGSTGQDRIVTPRRQPKPTSGARATVSKYDKSDRTIEVKGKKRRRRFNKSSHGADEDHSVGSESSGNNDGGESAHMDTLPFSHASYRSNAKATRKSLQMIEYMNNVDPANSLRVRLRDTDGDNIETDLIGPGTSCPMPWNTSQKRRHFPGSKMQALGEDIVCNAGLVFGGPALAYEADSDAEWVRKYEGGPGITRARATAYRNIKKGRRGGPGFHNSVSAFSSSAPGSDSVCYKSVTNYRGVHISLGTHPSSAAALATQDLANLALLGSEHSKTMQILSRDEAWAALKATNVPGVKSCGQVDPCETLFTEDFKPVFEEMMENALASIGGQDDILADMICGIDANACRQAVTIDARLAKEQEQKEKKEEKERARRANRRVEKTTRARRNAQRSTCGDCFGKANKPLFKGEHGIYGVDDKGIYFWMPSEDLRRLSRYATRAQVQPRTKNVCSAAKTTKSVLEGDETQTPDKTNSHTARLISGAYNREADGTPLLQSENDLGTRLKLSSSPAPPPTSLDTISSSTTTDLSVSLSTRTGKNDKVIISSHDFSDDNILHGTEATHSDGLVASRVVRTETPPRSIRTRDRYFCLSPRIPDAIMIENGKNGQDDSPADAFQQDRNDLALNLQSKALPHVNLPFSQPQSPPSPDTKARTESDVCYANNSSTNEIEMPSSIVTLLQDFIVTPLLSTSSRGIRLSSSKARGKTLTGIKFERKATNHSSKNSNVSSGCAPYARKATITGDVGSVRRREEFIISISASQVNGNPDFRIREGSPALKPL